MPLIRFHAFRVDASFTKQRNEPLYCLPLWQTAWADKVKQREAVFHDPRPTDFAQILDRDAEWDRLVKAYGEEQVKEAFGNTLAFRNLFDAEAEKAKNLTVVTEADDSPWIVVRPKDDLDAETRAALAGTQLPKVSQHLPTDVEARLARLEELEAREAAVAEREKALADAAKDKEPNPEEVELPSGETVVPASEIHEVPAPAPEKPVAKKAAAKKPAAKKRGRPTKEEAAARAAEAEAAGEG